MAGQMRRDAPGRPADVGQQQHLYAVGFQRSKRRIVVAGADRFALAVG